LAFQRDDGGPGRLVAGIVRPADGA